MCIICIKPQGVDFPTQQTMETMYQANHDGCGYMFTRDNMVRIRKGFMTLEELQDSMKKDELTKNDIVILHFRITTQGGVQKALCHPYPLSRNMEHLKTLRCKCNVGIAHNGIIRLTSDSNVTDYNDTMKFITDYMSNLFVYKKDLDDEKILKKIEQLAQSKFAILKSDGTYHTIGQFIKDWKTGLLYSNSSYINYSYEWKNYKANPRFSF